MPSACSIATNTLASAGVVAVWTTTASGSDMAAMVSRPAARPRQRAEAAALASPAAAQFAVLEVPGARVRRGLAAPPPDPRGALVGRAEGVVRDAQPHLPRRPPRERIVAEQPQHRRRALEHALQQPQRPRGILGEPAVERREPELPVEPRHVEAREHRGARRIGGLVAEAVRLPLGAVVAAL